MTRVGAIALAALVALAGCSGDDEGDGREEAISTTTTASRVASDAWNQVVVDPCTLLEAGDVAAVFGVEAPEPAIDAPDRSCRYPLGEQRTIEVVVFRPMTDAGRRDRLRGTEPGPQAGTHLLVLDVPGAAVYLDAGSALVLLAHRDPSGVQPLPDTSMAELAGLVAGRVPDGPAPEANDPDPCSAVPAERFGAGMSGGDPVDADTCAYRADDGTSVRVRIDRTGSMPDSAGLAELWDAVGGGATWQGTLDPDAQTGSGVGFVPLDQGVASITVSSPERPLAELRRQAEAVALALVTGS